MRIRYDRDVNLKFLALASLLALGCGGTTETPNTTDASSTIDASATIDAAPSIDADLRTGCTTAAGSHILFVNTQGGSYIQGASTSPLLNRSRIIQADGTLAPWNVPAAAKNAMLECVREVLAPFNIVVTTDEPSVEPYHEISVSSSTSTVVFPAAQVPSIGELGCTPLSNVISFAFTNFSDNPLTVCQSVTSHVGISQGLSRVTPDCEDAMTFTFECDARVGFLNGLQECGNQQPLDCSCTNMPTQNSIQRLIQTVGACP